MKPLKRFVGGLLLAVSTSIHAELGWEEGLSASVMLVATYPVVIASSALSTTTTVAEEMSDGDQRVIMDARDGALQAVANGNLDDARLQAALRLLRRRHALDGMDDLQLAQWLAVHE